VHRDLLLEKKFLGKKIPKIFFLSWSEIDRIGACGVQYLVQNAKSTAPNCAAALLQRRTAKHLISAAWRCTL